uniref:Uncharacterized protein n=1 Tax=Oryza brachyantha TaxID=4533 RepID=J3MKD7_ORYBR
MLTFYRRNKKTASMIIANLNTLFLGRHHCQLKQCLKTNGNCQFESLFFSFLVSNKVDGEQTKKTNS